MRSSLRRCLRFAPFASAPIELPPYNALAEPMMHRRLPAKIPREQAPTILPGLGGSVSRSVFDPNRRADEAEGAANLVLQKSLI